MIAMIKKTEQLSVSTIRETISQSLGLSLNDEVIAEALAGKPLTLDQLSENNNLTEVGTALIRLDGLSKMFPAKNDMAGLRICVKTPFGEWCTNINMPPQE
jgi:hypothetical protein